MRDLKTKTAGPECGVVAENRNGGRAQRPSPILTLLGLLLLFGLGFGHELQVFTIALGLHAVARDEP